MQEVYGVAKLARFLPWWPVVYVEATPNWAQSLSAVSISLVIKNSRPRPILIRSIAVQLPHRYAVGRSYMDGELSEKQLPMLRGLDKPSNLIIRPGSRLRIDLVLDPADGMDLHISWRSQGMRSWPCIPMNVRRSRQQLLDECNLDDNPARWHGDW